MTTEFDWALAMLEYCPDCEYRLDDSANPTKILYWKGGKPQPTIEQLREAAAQIKPAPNWRGFGLDLISTPEYLRIANAMSQKNPSLVVVMKIALNNTEDLQAFQNVAAMWNILILAVQPTQAEIDMVQLIADRNYLPIVFAADGTVSIAE